jgi:hypothetical protein
MDAVVLVAIVTLSAGDVEKPMVKQMILQPDMKTCEMAKDHFYYFLPEGLPDGSVTVNAACVGGE